MINNKKAFTLAEVLVTLVVIGIVAALTIPVVVQKYKKYQTEVQFKKAYNTLSTTLSLAQAEYGDYGAWDVADGGSSSLDASEKYYEAYLKPYLKVSKYCGRTSGKGCDYAYSRLNEASKTIPDDRYTRFYLNDGIFIAFFTSTGKWYSYCNSVQCRTLSEYTGDKTGDYEYRGAYEDDNAQFLVDINGDKKPNVLGKDVFWLRFDHMPTTWTNKDGTVETSGQKGKLSGDCVYTDKAKVYDLCKKSGSCCSGLIILDGLKIKDDYPVEL